MIQTILLYSLLSEKFLIESLNKILSFVVLALFLDMSGYFVCVETFLLLKWIIIFLYVNFKCSIAI